MAQNLAKGKLNLTIDESELFASLSFEPEAEGAEWTGEKVLRLVMDARVGGVNQKRAEEIVAKFARAKGPVTEVLAQGQAPEEPEPERPEWCELPVPEDMASLVAAALESAAPPKLFRVRVETIKTEKTVKTPAALPFLPPKIEKITVVEKKELREPVRVSPEIVKTGYARKDERLGLLSSAKPGKPGKSIFGKPIQPLGKDEGFVLGEGIVRQKHELLAARDGILRAGERWAELLPLARHAYGLSKSADGATCFLSYSPGAKELSLPDPAAILKEAEALGFAPDALLSEAELRTLLLQATEEGEPLYSRSISQDRDASIEIRLEPDGTKAYLELKKGRGRGRPLDLKDLSAALKASGVKGLNAEKLKKDVLEFYKSEAAELSGYVLAEGRAPTRGADRGLALTVSLLPAAKAEELLARVAGAPGLTQLLPSLGDFPLAAAAKLAFVQEGQVFAELDPPSPGQPGLDVRGTVLPGLPGNDPSVRAFENVELGKKALTARASGLLMAAEEGGAWRFRVLPYREAQIEAGISPDGMSAWLSLGAEQGAAKPLTAEAALEALAAKGVAFGLESGAVAEAVAAARRGEAVLRRVVARGREPVPPGSAKLTWIVKLASGAAVTTGADGRADYRNQDRMTRVAAGEALLRVERIGGAGEPGVDVTGKPVDPPAAGGQAGPPEHDASVREESAPDGSVLLVAAAAGELLVEGGKLSIRERFALPADLGPATGNVRFPGPVRVGGNVLAGFQLFAGGDVEIGGAVEAALVSSDGTVKIAGGIKGARRGTIRAKRGIEAAFAEQAVLLAVDDIKLKSGCVLCNVKTNGLLLVSGERGSLVGGLTRARRGAEVGALGSENGAKTEISFGQDYLMADMIEAEEREIEKLKALVLQTDKSIAELAKAGTGLDRARQDKVKLLKLLEKRTLRLFDFREKFEEHTPSEIRVRGAVFPGVILESHNRFFEVRSRKSGVAFSFDPKVGRIVERPL